MAEGIQYNRELFDFINNLTAINNAIAFERIGDKVVVRKADKNRTLPYILSVPSEYFDIDETVAFYKFDNFYRFFNSYRNPVLNIEDDRMIMSEGRSRTRYTLSDEEGIINGPKRVNFEQGDVRFTLTKEALDEIGKQIGLTKADRAKISVEEDAIRILFFSTVSDNDHEAEFEYEKIDGFDGEFEFTIFANRFEFLPSKHDYIIDVSSERYVRFSLVDDNIEFNMYSGDLS